MSMCLLLKLVPTRGDRGVETHPHSRTSYGGWGLPPPPPRMYEIAISGKKQAFGQNHLIFGQAMKKIFGQGTSPPPPPGRNTSRTPICLVYGSTHIHCMRFTSLLTTCYTLPMYPPQSSPAPHTTVTPSRKKSFP